MSASIAATGATRIAGLLDRLAGALTLLAGALRASGARGPAAEDTAARARRRQLRQRVEAERESARTDWFGLPGRR